MIHRHITASLFVVAAACPAAWAQESSHTYTRAVPETHYVDHQSTVYTPRTTTEYHPTSRTVYTPVTEYQWEPYLANRWNPFSSPSVQYRYVPRTRWEMRSEQVHIPVTRNELIPETRTQKVAVQSYRYEDVTTTTRVAVRQPGNDPFAGNTAVAAKPLGSTGQLTNDPPKSASTSTMYDRR
jgi:hypothetical protein